MCMQPARVQIFDCSMHGRWHWTTPIIDQECTLDFGWVRSMRVVKWGDQNDFTTELQRCVGARTIRVVEFLRDHVGQMQFDTMLQDTVNS